MAPVQARVLALGNCVCEVAPIFHVTVVLDILPGRRVRQPILKPHGLDAGHEVLRPVDRQRGPPHPLLIPLQADIRMHFARAHPFDRLWRVEARRDGAAERLDGRDGGLRGPGHDDVDGLFQGGGAVGEEFDPVSDPAHGTAFGELAQSDGLFGGDASLVDPGLDSVEIYGGHFDRVPMVRGRIWR